MRRLIRWACLIGALVVASAAHAIGGRVVDASNGRPIAMATVVLGDEVRRTDEHGHFEFAGAPPPFDVSARAIGFTRERKGVQEADTLILALKPIRPKALYLSANGVGSSVLLGEALTLIDTTELNSLVIDIKGDRGQTPYRSAAAAAAGLAQSAFTVANMAALMSRLREHDIYLIARIVVFKDEPLASLRPQWAVRDARGGAWKDRESLGWIDPFQRQAWERSLALAEEAAKLGFDEIQFDYLRFPDAKGLVFSQSDTEEQRVATINAFLDAARQRLRGHNVFISADIFGYVTWNTNDTGIGQHLETIVERVDYLSPMLYPSGFTFGIPGHHDPMDAPFEIVHQSLQRAMWRTGLSGLHFRPWLQAFQDYAFDRRNFGAQEIRAQIDAAQAAGSDGWMLWNPRNRYVGTGLAQDYETDP